jgi:hypothetical protein
MAFVQPNLWILSGGGIHVRHSTTGATFHYQDTTRNLTFTAQQIRTVPVPDLGTLVSVTIFLTVDSGSSTFTVLLPNVNLAPPPNSSAPVKTEGITTAHHFSLVPALLHGQTEFYSVTPLSGAAYHV